MSRLKQLPLLIPLLFLIELPTASGMYDPHLGRFCSKDPIGYEGSKWSLYEFANSEPFRKVDPAGTSPGLCIFVYNAIAAGPICMGYATRFENEKGGPYAPGNDPGNHKTHCFVNCCMTMANLGAPTAMPPMNLKEPFELPGNGLNDCAGDCSANFRGCCEAWKELFGSDTGSCYQRCSGVPFIPRPKPKPPRRGKDPWPKSRFPCFEGSTIILTAQGEKLIRDIGVGELVVGFNLENMEVELTPVTKVLVHSEGPYRLNSIQIGQDDVQVTAGHPVFDGDRWVLSHELNGKCLTTSLGKTFASAKPSNKVADRVFNLVTGNGTFAVGRNGLVVSGKVSQGDSDAKIGKDEVP